MSVEEIVKSHVHMLHTAARKFPGRQIVVSGIIPKLMNKSLTLIMTFTSRSKPSLVSYRHIMAIYAMVECTKTTNI